MPNEMEKKETRKRGVKGVKVNESEAEKEREKRKKEREEDDLQRRILYTDQATESR